MEEGVDEGACCAEGGFGGAGWGEERGEEGSGLGLESGGVGERRRAWVAGWPRRGVAGW